jgi:dTMP kinase
MPTGIFITFEGPEGSGKSTHLPLLASWLKKQGRKVLLTREPGGTKLSEAFRRLLLDTGDGLSPLAELFLYEADRAQHVEEILLPALKRGEVVLCDRYTDSTVAYQGDGRGLSHETIADLNRIASQALAPHLTILLDVPVQRGLAQAHAKKKKHDRLERAGVAFHKRVRSGFLALAKADSKRFRVIEQQPTIEATQAQIRQAVEIFLGNQLSPRRKPALPPSEEAWAQNLGKMPQL